MAVERIPPVQVRQGDVLLTPQTSISYIKADSICESSRDLLNDDKEAVLATGKGESHPHKVVGDVRFVESTSGRIIRQQPDDRVSRLLVIGPAGATVVHDEHDSIELPPNSVYVVFRQLETLVGDDNAPTIHQTTGILANDRQPSRRYVED